ncbi:MAG: helix-turn-helix transcriptional regulator [Bacteroidota bacterium]
MAVLRIKEIMLQKGISRLDLANQVEVTETTISNICTEKFYPKVELLLKLSEALDVDVRELFIPTKGNVIGKTELIEAKELISKGLKILEGKD